MIRLNIFDYPEADITKLAQAYQLSQVPTTLIVDREGKVVQRYDKEFPEDQVRKALEGVTR